MSDIANWVERLEVEPIFSEELQTVRGKIRERCCHGKNLFLKAVLPWEERIRDGDPVQAGVALRTTRRQIRVHPYVLRLVCINGFIVTRAVGSKTIDVEVDSTDDSEAAAVREQLRGTIRACSRPVKGLDLLLSGRLEKLMEQMKSAGRLDVDRVLADLEARILSIEPYDTEAPAIDGRDIAGRIRQQLTREDGRTRFGLMNAVTAVAREAENPELKWRLEEIGGSIAVGQRSARRSLSTLLLLRELQGQTSKVA
jgi:hypothetical protein